MSTQLVEKAEKIGTEKLWGKHSLNLGELIGFIAGAVIIYKQPFGKYSTLVGFAVIFVTEALF